VNDYSFIILIMFYRNCVKIFLYELTKITFILDKKMERYNKLKIDELVKSLEIVMPDLIQHPERIEFTGFWLSPE